MNNPFNLYIGKEYDKLNRKCTREFKDLKDQFILQRL